MGGGWFLLFEMSEQVKNQLNEQSFKKKGVTERKVLLENIVLSAESGMNL